MTTSTLPEPPPAAAAAEPEDHPAAPPETAAHLRHPLPLWVHIAVLAAGWVVLLIGVAGLVLPGPGVLMILAGLAILSISSELAHRCMRRTLRRWPGLARRVESFRTRLHDWLHRMVRRGE